MNNSQITVPKTRKPTEWDIFRTKQLEILKEIKKQTGKYISGKGNVMKYIGELWRTKKINDILATFEKYKVLTSKEKCNLSKLLDRNNTISSVIDIYGECKYIACKKPQHGRTFIYV